MGGFVRKIITCILLGSICFSSFCTKRQRSDGPADQCEPMEKRRRTLSVDQQELLDQILVNLVIHANSRSVDKRERRGLCCKIERLLEQGANPNVVYQGDTMLGFLVDQPVWRENVDLVKILLSWGADPRLPVDRGPILPSARNFDMVRLLICAGADINATRDDAGSKSTVLINLCNSCFCGANLPEIVWLLRHGADANGGPGEDDNGLLAIHYALFAHELDITIALLQSGARIDKKTADRVEALEYARNLEQDGRCAWNFEGDHRLIARTQRELLEAVAFGLDIQRSYSIHEYEAMRISTESARLIQQATDRVREQFEQSALEELKNSPSGRNLSKFICMRETRLI